MLYRCLRDLDESLGGRLLVVRGDPADVVPRIAAAVDAPQVHVAADFGPYGRTRDEAVEKALAEHDDVGTGPAARSPRLVAIDETDAPAGVWRVEQTIDDPAGDHDWRIRAEVDLRESAEEGAAVVRVTEVVRL